MTNTLYSVIFTEDCSQKGVFSGRFEELFESYKRSQCTQGHGLKKHSKSIKRLQWMITLIHLKLMIFMLLNNCYLFLFIILFICFLMSGCVGSSLLSTAFSSCGEQGLLLSWNVLTFPFGGISHHRSWDRGVGISGHGPPGSSRVLSSCGAWA